MKLNWGTGIFLGIAVFMSFILYFVVNLQVNPKYDHELVSETYYKDEALVDQNRIATEKANALKQNLKFEKNENGIVIQFPTDFDYKLIRGKISLYRPSNQKLDFSKSITLSNSSMLIPKQELVGGLWEITVNWNYNTNTYRTKETINY